MAYHLLNIETLEYYYCDENDWLNAIETAKENYWEPDGTVFDVYYETDEKCFESDDYLLYMFTLIASQSESLDWDGSYFKKRNQVVSYEDSYYLAVSLDGTDTSTELIDFIKKGSFRICSE